MKTILTFLSFVVLWSYTTALAETTKHAVNGTYGCRRSFGYGVYNASAKKTVICWNGDKMSIYVREFDHETEKWSDMVKAHALNYDRKNDYHNYPCIALAPDGHYLIFYFRHSQSAYMVKSPGPDTIHGKWTHKKLSDDKCAYPMPVLFGVLEATKTGRHLRQVVRTSTIAIRRHIKIKADANPYLPEDAEYFQNRRNNNREERLPKALQLTILFSTAA